MFTRRRFAASAIALPAALRTVAQPATSASPFLFLGTDNGKGIFRARWNSTTGEVGPPELAVTTERPSWLTLHPTLPVLYATNAVAEPNAALSAFHVDRAHGTLTPFSRLGTHSAGPCAAVVDPSGHSAYAANYSGGSLTTFALAPDGSLAQTVGVFAYKQQTHGPVADRQDAAHLHCTTLSPGNDFVLVCDLGDDIILAFPIVPERGSFIGQPVRIAARPGSGPRHLAFHPNGRWLYCIHELDCTVDLYDWNVSPVRTTGGMEPAAQATLRPESVVSTLRPGQPLTGNTGCEILVSPDGRFLYTCTRGDNSIAVFRIDPATGLLAEQQRLSCGGAIPRYITFDPTRRWLLCANQGAPGSITVFAHNPSTGRITPTPQSFPADTPMYIQFL